MITTATRPEIAGLLSVAAHHERAIRSLEHVHWNDPHHQREVLEKHRRKLMRLLGRASRLAGEGELRASLRIRLSLTLRRAERLAGGGEVTP